ncbi:MAG: ArsR/SmtB family transcription factor [Candidatus Woesearchaeota archaeon]
MKVEGRVEKQKKDEPMNNNFLLISLEEKKAKKIAEAINNETSRKILDHLAKKECTESDLSKEMNIPISTIHYNLKQLMEANLVVVDEFHYSSKGKEVNHYKLANKYIIIAPRQTDNRFMEALQKILPLTIITAVTGGILTLFGLINGTGSNLSAKSATNTAMDAAAPRLMMASEETVLTASGSAGAAMPQAITAEVSRPFMQSSPVAWFFIGALSIIIIYFLYEVVKRRK